MKNRTGVIVGALAVILIVIGVAYHENNKAEQSGGNLYVGVTDATSDISNVTDVDMSVKKVEIHNATNGWMTVSSDEKTYPLLSLNASGKTDLYAKETNVPAGTYDKVRVTLGNTVVHTKNNGDVQAVMPTSQVVMDTTLHVNKGENTNYKMDFLADKSLHATSDGKYVFTPVVNTQATSNATVSVAGDNTMNVSGGTVDTNASVGVDLDGTSKPNFILNTDNTLKIGSAVGNQLNFVLGGKTYTSDNTKVQEDENTTDNMDMNMNGSTSSGSTSGSSNSTQSGGLNINSVIH